MAIKWHIGCSGFHYKEWKIDFYPDKLPQRKWFEYYSSKFDTLELNVTFYRFPHLSFLQNWFEKSPEEFKFSVKAPRLITHYKKFNDTEQLLADFYGTIKEGLQEKLGPVLFQMHPKMPYDEETLKRIIQSLDNGFKNVLEFRHESWWNNHVYNELAKNNLTFCGISYPKLPQTIVADNPLLYYRFHGIPKLYYSEYDEDTLRKTAEAISETAVTKEAYIFFNNTAGLGAIQNAMFLKKLLVESK